MSKTRSIFEEVGEKQEAPATAPGAIDKGRGGARGAIRAWLILLAALVVVMITVGGLTRLTDSGLSITEWAPVTGAIPPMDAATWESEFEKYRAIPEYQLQNKGMSLAEFKVIYWWEWGHRQLGRVIGLVWAVGFLYFLIRRQIPTGWTGRLLLLGALGGLQGAIGWWMVASGLTGTMLDVASYRLATHLGLAFVIIGFIAWFSFELARPEREIMQARRLREARLGTLASVFVGALFIQILIGALVAGIDAGRSYNDWPLMSGEVFPSNALDLEPMWRNFFENAGMVQFIHRTWGYLVFALAIYLGVRAAKSPHKLTRKAFGRVGLLITAMVVIGIVTVLMSAPLWIAITHQFVGVLLWVAAIYALFLTRFPIETSVRDA
ncbi:heme A synthase [Shimia ponticola]|uniref:heme A synthase n=1 Tax=Shimia ponticola TaxID=2582893 RepID=UPI0011BE9F37|nr:heme A synthase [Shimia ponticola]